MRPVAVIFRGHILAHASKRNTCIGPNSAIAAVVVRRSNFCSSAQHGSNDAPTRQLTDSWKVAKIPHRGVIEVSGRDTVKLLQGLVSNDVRSLEPNKTESSGCASPALVYAGFLNPQGRMLADAFIHRQPALDDGSPRWLLDVDSGTLPSLLAFIKKFKLRSKVKLSDVSNEYHIVQAWSSSSSSSPPSSIADRFCIDPRCNTMGFRGVLPSSASFETDTQVEMVDGDEYTLHRIVNGVAEGSLDFPQASSLPLESNLDYMNGVDFRKGCYVGQELTARTHHTGVVRKRIVPISFYLPNTPPPTHLTQIDRSFSFKLPNHLAEIRSRPVNSDTASAVGKPTRGKAAGKFTTGIYNLGLACLRLEQVQRWTHASSQENTSQDGLEMSVLAADGETTLLVRPWIPSWWPKETPMPQQGEE